MRSAPALCSLVSAATLLTLIVVPALYAVVNDLRRLGYWLRHGGAYPTAESLESLHDVRSMP